MPELDETQYSILQDRIWRYNDLLWKNFLGYGAALAFLGQYRATWKTESQLALWVVYACGICLLALMALIQFTFLQGLQRTVREARALEIRKNWLRITRSSRDVEKFSSVSVQRAYCFATVGMFLVPIASIIYILYSACDCCPP